MRKLLFFPILLVSIASWGQKCVKKSNLSPQARMKKIPFNSASQVQMVGYTGLVRMPDESSADFHVSIAGDVGYVNGPVTEAITLTRPQIDSLTNILFNYGYAYPPGVHRTTHCYDPHNAILFRDQHGKPLAFIEICFECQKTTTAGVHGISLGDMCYEKLDMLKRLFRQVGIKQGVQ